MKWTGTFSGAAWLKLSTNIDSDLRFVRLARILGVPVSHAIGIVIRLWTWTARHAPLGCLHPWTAEEVGAIAEGPGSTLNQTAVHNALTEARFVKHDELGRIIVEGFPDMVASLLKDRSRRLDATLPLPGVEEVSDQSSDESPDEPLDRARYRGEERGGEEREGKRGERGEELYRPSSVQRYDAVVVRLIDLLEKHPRFRAIRKPVSFALEARGAYPSVDLLKETRKASAFLVANPKRAYKNFGRFLLSWYSRAESDYSQDAPRPKARTISAPTSGPPPIPDSPMSLDEYRSWLLESARQGGPTVDEGWLVMASDGRVPNVSATAGEKVDS